MKKQFIIFGIIVLLICIGLSGCTEENSKFVGTWRLIDGNGYYSTIVLYSDGTATLTVRNLGNSYSATYKIKDDKLVFDAEGQHQDLSFDYSFSGDNILLLAQAGTTSYSTYTNQNVATEPSESDESSDKVSTLSMNIYSRDDATNQTIWLVSGIEGEPVEDGTYDTTLLTDAGTVDATATFVKNEVTGAGYINAGDTFTVTASKDGYYVFWIIDIATGSTIYKSTSTKY